MATHLVWDPVSDLYYGMSLTWGGWWPGKDGNPGASTAVPFGTCSLHGAWDTRLYFSCPGCVTAAPVKFRVYPELPEVPPIIEVRFEDEKRPYKCPICEGRGDLDGDFYTRLGYATDTGRVPCRACDNGIVWR